MKLVLSKTPETITVADRKSIIAVDFQTSELCLFVDAGEWNARRLRLGAADRRYRIAQLSASSKVFYLIGRYEGHHPQDWLILREWLQTQGPGSGVQGFELAIENESCPADFVVVPHKAEGKNGLASWIRLAVRETDGEGRFRLEVLSAPLDSERGLNPIWNAPAGYSSSALRSYRFRFGFDIEGLQGEPARYRKALHREGAEFALPPAGKLLRIYERGASSSVSELVRQGTSAWLRRHYGSSGVQFVKMEATSN